MSERAGIVGVAVRKLLTPVRLAAVALALHAGLVLLGSAHDSVTIDEVGHVPAGVAYLQRGAFDVNPQPPLVKLLGAGLALAAGARSDYEHAWREAAARGATVHYPDLARDFMAANATPPGHYHRLYRAARVVVLPFSLLLGVVLFLWGRDLFGAWGGLLALTLWCFSPNAIGVAALFTSDVPVSALMLTATYLFWRWLRSPRLAGAFACGAVLGLAQLTKLTALSLYGIWPLLALPALFGLAGAPHRRFREALPGALVILATSLLVLNAGYGFAGTGHRLGEPDYLSTSLTRPRRARVDVAPHHAYRDVYAARVNRFRGTPLEALPVPLPRAFLAGVDLQGFEARPGLPGAGWYAYLRGEIRKGSWWYYFPYALAVKSTPSFLLLLFATPIALVFVRRMRLTGADEAFLWGPPAVLLASMATTGVDLGVRYALPVLPFLMLATARLARPLRWRAVTPVLVLVVLLHASSAFWIGRHALAYFSPLAGGPSAGHRHLADSNLDWGQELLHLRRWLDARGVQGPVSAALFSNADPAIYGLETRMIPRDPRALRGETGLAREPDEPPCLVPGLHVLSANFVVGLPFRLIRGERVIPVPVGAYAYFGGLEPTAEIGYALRAYEVTSEQAADLDRRLRLRCPKPTPEG